MQTALLSLGIAIIVVLVAALVGPPLIDWGYYRAAVEARASGLAGVPVRVGGPITVRLLPTLSLKLSDVEIGEAGSPRNVKAHTVAMEFSLGALMRGEVQARDVAVDGPEMMAALDQSGHVEMFAFSPGFDPDRFGIEHFTVGNGRLTLIDAASGGRLAIDNIVLSGSANSLAGPFKAEGSFAQNGEQFGYRISASRRGSDGGTKFRLAIDANERALTFESNGAVWVENGSPRYEGAMTLSRVIGTAAPGRPITINVPWKLAGKLKATARDARFEQVDLQYGPEARAIWLTGAADLTFGREPRMAATLAARQINLDRMLPADTPRRRPMEQIKALIGGLVAAQPTPWPVHVTLGIDSLTVGGGILTAVHGEFGATTAGWDLGSVAFRAPGATQVRMSGRLAQANGDVEFTGPVAIDSNAPAPFFAWIAGNSAAGAPALDPMRGSGTVTLGGTRIAVEAFKAEIDRKVLQGRVEYRFATSSTKARLQAMLAGAEVDIGGAVALGTAVFAAASLERAGEIALGLDIGRAFYRGTEAREISVKLSFDRSGLNIERLSAADFGGASLDAHGRIDSVANLWRGSIAMSAAAPRLDGVLTVFDQFLPELSEALRRNKNGRAEPFNLNAYLDVEPQSGAAGHAKTAATVKADGKIAGIKLHIDGTAIGDVADPAAAEVHVAGHFDAEDGRLLSAVVGLDRLATVSTRPALLSFQADGAAGRPFVVEAKFAGPDIDVSANGRVNQSGTAALNVAFRAADAKLPRRAGSSPLPVDLHMRLVRDGDAIDLTEISGKAAGSAVAGRLSFRLGGPLRINGQIKADQVDAREVMAVLTGAPRETARRAAVAWVAEPFAPVNGADLEGRIDFQVATAQWIAGLVTHDLAGTLMLEPGGFSLTGVAGTLADGQLALDASVKRQRGGLALQSRMTLNNADLPALLADALPVPASGRLSLSADVQGEGLSPAALVGALEGGGVLTVEHIDIAGLNPSAIEVVLNALASNRSLASNTIRVAQIANAALDAGRLQIEVATAPIVFGEGRARIVKFAAPAKGADISGSITVGLNDWQFDSRLLMTVPDRTDASNAPPAMALVVKGPLRAARRSADVTDLIGWEMARAGDEDIKALGTAETERHRLETGIGLRRAPELVSEARSPHAVSEARSPHAVSEARSPHAVSEARSPHSASEARLPHSVSEAKSPRPARRPVPQSPKAIVPALPAGRR